MKLQQLLNLAENSVASASSSTNSLVSSTSGTTSGAVAKYSPVISDEPLKRMSDKNNKVSFMKYATTSKECPGCSIIKKHGWQEVGGAKTASKELTCQMCGKSHKKGN